MESSKDYVYSILRDHFPNDVSLDHTYIIVKNTYAVEVLKNVAIVRYNNPQGPGERLEVPFAELSDLETVLPVFIKGVIHNFHKQYDFTTFVRTLVRSIRNSYRGIESVDVNTEYLNASIHVEHFDFSIELFLNTETIRVIFYEEEMTEINLSYSPDVTYTDIINKRLENE